MSLPVQITEFVRSALQSGRSTAEIDSALQAAGWSQREREEALGAWVTLDGLPPVPRPRPYLSAYEALLYGLLFISLGIVALNLVQLGSQLVDLLLPITSNPDWVHRPAVRWPIAALITFTPVFWLLSHLIQTRTAANQGLRRSLVRKWFAAITLLIAALILLGDLAYAIYAFLDGEMSLRFACKALILAGVSGLIIAYYRDEMDE